MKSQVFNLIIIDKSGSMQSIRDLAINGLNETLQSIRMAAKKNPELEQYVTLVAFCGCGRKYIYDAKPISQCRNITVRDYQPCCMTPLYDAIGEACTRMKAVVAGRVFAPVNVTIITDGYENASKEYDHAAISRMISDLKQDCWTFGYIGADHDVESVAYSLNIDNCMSFDKEEEGVKKMFARERRAREKHNELLGFFSFRMEEMKSINPNMSDAELHADLADQVREAKLDYGSDDE